MSLAQRLPPRPSSPRLRVPRPEPRSAGRVSTTRVTQRSEPRVSLHSVDLEVVAQAEQSTRATLLSPVPDEEPIDVVIEALRNATCESAIEAASLALAWSARAVHARAALAHLYDPESQEFVVVYALGERAGHLLMTRHPCIDDALAAAVTKGAPRIDNYGLKRPPPSRYAFFGGAWSAIVAPVMDGDRVLGAIELVDPLDGSCFDERSIAASCYAAKRLAEILSPFDGTIGAVVRPPED